MSYQVQFEHNIPVPMRDGVVLAADVHRPASGGEIIEGALPVLLQRTPYNKASEARIEEATFFAANGYVTVMQDCRGRFESEGGFSKYVDDARDGYDTVEWLAHAGHRTSRPLPSGPFHPVTPGSYLPRSPYGVKCQIVTAENVL